MKIEPPEEIPISRAGKIEVKILEKIADLIGKDMTDCDICTMFRSLSARGNFSDGEDLFCYGCSTEWINTKLGLVLKSEKPDWLNPGVPSFISDPYNFSCPKCIIEDGVLVVYAPRNDKEKSAFARNFFFLRCARCAYEKPYTELEMGEHKHFLWYNQNLKSTWPLTQTLKLWDDPIEPMPLPMKKWKKPNRQRGVKD